MEFPEVGNDPRQRDGRTQKPFRRQKHNRYTHGTPQKFLGVVADQAGKTRKHACSQLPLFFWCFLLFVL